MNCYLHETVGNDPVEKMVFLNGPREVGKTTLVLSLLENGDEPHPAYLNWIDLQSRWMLLGGALPADQQLAWGLVRGI